MSVIGQLHRAVLSQQGAVNKYQEFFVIPGIPF
jgi:hypothetical protein